MKEQLRDDKVKFRVKYSFKNPVDPEKIEEGIETEASWYLIDQQGKFYSYGPMDPITPCRDETSLQMLIHVNGEWLTISEIEERLKKEKT